MASSTGLTIKRCVTTDDLFLIELRNDTEGGVRMDVDGTVYDLTEADVRLLAAQLLAAIEDGKQATAGAA